MKQFDAEQALLPLVVMFPSASSHCSAVSTEVERPLSTFYPSELANIISIDRRSWEKSREYGFLKGALKAYASRLSKVDTVIGFGCGNLSTGRTRCPYSTTQHALVFSLQKILSKMHPENHKVLQGFRQVCKKERVNLVVRALFQDPAYSELDENVLHNMGVVIKDDPFGFLDINENTFVVAIDLNTPVQQIIESIARPAAIIRLPYEDAYPGAKPIGFADPATEKVTKMLREEYDFVRLRYHPYLREICVYIRKPKPGTKKNST